MVAYTCNPNSQEAEAGGPRVQSQWVLHCKTLSQKQKHLLDMGIFRKYIFFCPTVDIITVYPKFPISSLGILCSLTFEGRCGHATRFGQRNVSKNDVWFFLRKNIEFPVWDSLSGAYSASRRLNNLEYWQHMTLVILIFWLLNKAFYSCKILYLPRLFGVDTTA